MRQFVVLGHDAPVEPGIPLDDLPGAAGRLDVLCRCVSAAFLLSHGIREDVRTFLVLRDRVALRFEGAELRYLTPDERNVASLIDSALAALDEAVGHREATRTPGIYVSTRGVGAVLDALEGPVVQLHEHGDPVVDVSPPADAAFVLSDHRDVTDAEEDRLSERRDARVRVGPERIHADHAITIVHNFLDTDGYTRY